MDDVHLPVFSTFAKKTVLFSSKMPLRTGTDWGLAQILFFPLQIISSDTKQNIKDKCSLYFSVWKMYLITEQVQTIECDRRLMREKGHQYCG